MLSILKLTILWITVLIIPLLGSQFASYEVYIQLCEALKNKEYETIETNLSEIKKHTDFPYLSKKALITVGNHFFKETQYEKAIGYYQTAFQTPTDYATFSDALLNAFHIHKTRETYIQILIHNLEASQNQLLFSELQKSIPSIRKIEDVFCSPWHFHQFIKNLYQNCQYKEVVYYANQLLNRFTRYKNKGDVQLLLGMSRYFQYEFSYAIANFKKIKRYYSNDTQIDKALFYLARSYQRSQDYNKAIKYFKIVIKKDQSFVSSAYYHLLTILKKKKRHRSYDHYFKKFQTQYAHTDPYNQLIWDRGYHALTQNQPQKAVSEFEHLSDDAPNKTLKSKILFWKGIAYQQLHNETLSQNSFRICTEKYPFSFFTFRILDQYLSPDNKQKISHYLPQSKIKPDPKIQWLIEKGLGKLALEEINYILNYASKHMLSKDKLLYLRYQLAYLNSTIGSPHETILAIRDIFKLNYSSNKDPELPKEFAKLLYPKAFWDEVRRYAKQYKVDPFLILAMMRKESLFKHTIKSRANAVGLIQIMPNTGKEIARKLKIPWKGTQMLEDVSTNIQFGTYYFAWLIKQFNDPILALAAYNAGPSRIKQWMKHYDPTNKEKFIANIQYPETQKYVVEVLENYWIYQLLYHPDTFNI